jgi:hypothetical protein
MGGRSNCGLEASIDPKSLELQFFSERTHFGGGLQLSPLHLSCELKNVGGPNPDYSQVFRSKVTGQGIDSSGALRVARARTRISSPRHVPAYAFCGETKLRVLE